MFTIKKYIFLLIPVIFCFSLFSCHNLSTAPQENAQENQIHQPELIYDESEEIEEDPIIYDFGERNFTIAMYNDDLFLPAADSSPISNRIIERNAEIEEAFNIRITALENITKSNFISELSSAYNSGTFCGDLLILPNYMLPLFVSQKSLMSIKALPWVNLEAECYNKKAVDSATIGNFVHAVFGDITYMPGKSVCVFFNKDFISSNNLSSPYDMEKNGEWTWDSFTELSKTVSQDVNRNYKPDFEDIYGMSSSYTASDVVDIMWASCGQNYFDNKPPHMPKMNFNGENTQIIIDKIRRLLYNDVNKIYISDARDTSGNDSFLKGNALFCIAPLEKAADFSAAGINFGVMPLPKSDASSDYYSYQDSSSVAVCVMNNIPDSDFTGAILQKLSEASSFNNSNYYKKYYVTNFLTDNSSALMLDKIFKNPYYDLAYTLGEAYQEVGAASNDIVHSNLSTGASFGTLYDLNNRQFETFVKNNFTYKGE